MKKFLFLTLTIVSLTLAGQVSAALINIDSFSSSQFEEYSVSRTAQIATASVNTGNASLGDSRTTKTEFVLGPAGSQSIIGKTTVSSSFYTYSSDVDAKIKSLLTWDANGSGLGGVNFMRNVVANNPFNNIGLLFDVSGFDQGSVDFTLNLKDTDGTDESIAMNVIDNGLQTLLFSDFTSSLNLASIDFVSLAITQLTDATDFKIDSFQVNNDLSGNYGALATPIPAAIWLFASGLLGIMGFSNRRKKSQTVIIA